MKFKFLVRWFGQVCKKKKKIPQKALINMNGMIYSVTGDCIHHCKKIHKFDMKNIHLVSTSCCEYLIHVA